MLFIVRRLISHYEVLKLRPNATPSQIKKAYRKLAKEHHPDVSQGNDQQFKLINIAYQTLKDENKRRLYDLSMTNTSFSAEADATTAQNEQPGRYGRQEYYKNRWYEGKKPNYDNLRDEYHQFMVKNAEKVWASRIAKMLLMVICYFGYHAMTYRMHPNDGEIEKNKKIIEQAVKQPQVYLGKLPLNHYIKHRSQLNKVQ